MLAFRPLQRYFDFSGRSGRAEYWQWILLTTVAGWIARAFDAAASSPYGSQSSVALSVLTLGTIIPQASVGIRRLHDRNLPGSWIYGGVIVATAILFLMVLAGEYLQQQSGSVLLLGASVVLGLPVLAGAIYLLVQLAMPGNPIANAYGEPDTYAPSAGVTDLTTKLLAPISPRPADTIEDDPIAVIERLAELRDQGVLTQVEFDEQKTAMLARLGRRT
ncbi:DUF805 domain-containing protein [Sphingomonas sp.]|uniref:DUF805 domain-containing protein n=1 Tax=Sphingomonas sp. TaxID=28214 RepID=UPI003B00A17B